MTYRAENPMIEFEEGGISEVGGRYLELVEIWKDKHPGATIRADLNEAFWRVSRDPIIEKRFNILGTSFSYRINEYEKLSLRIKRRRVRWRW